jgi:hypothetical protein
MATIGVYIAEWQQLRLQPAEPLEDPAKRGSESE